jgi:proliferating cell nuclear antigen
MFEARLIEGGVLKKLIDAIKDLVDNANFDCKSTGITLQAMDSSHVSLVSLVLQDEGFDLYRCDRNTSLGIALGNMGKFLKCASNDDIITLKAEDEGDELNMIFENPQQTTIKHFSLKLMDIDSEHMGIPDTDYACVVKMGSQQFARICRELAVIGETVQISTSKEGVKFSVAGDMGRGEIICNSSSAVDADEEDAVSVKLEEDISLSFAIKYLNSFAKATPLSPAVVLKLSTDVPLVVEYNLEVKDGEDNTANLGHLQFYLAPKIDDEEAEE